MDFRRVVTISDKEQRDAAIREQIEDEAWGDYLGDSMQKGGWPEDETVTDVQIEDDIDAITARISLTFTETVASSCSNITYDHNGTATFNLTIDRSDGSHDMECEDVDIAEYGDDDDGEFDSIYPGDYL